MEHRVAGLVLHVLTFRFTLPVNRKRISSHAHADRKWLAFHLQFRRGGFFCTKHATIHVRNFHHKDCHTSGSAPVIFKNAIGISCAFLPRHCLG